MPVSVSTSMAQMCVPCGKEKFSGSNVASASIEGSTPSGKLCAANVASAISWMETSAPGVPRTENFPPEKSRSSSLTSRSEEHTSELQSRQYLVCRLLLEKKQTSSRTKRTT